MGHDTAAARKTGVAIITTPSGEQTGPMEPVHPHSGTMGKSSTLSCNGTAITNQDRVRRQLPPSTSTTHVQVCMCAHTYRVPCRVYVSPHDRSTDGRGLVALLWSLPKLSLRPGRPGRAWVQIRPHQLALARRINRSLFRCVYACKESGAEDRVVYNRRTYCNRNKMVLLITMSGGTCRIGGCLLSYRITLCQGSGRR